MISSPEMLERVTENMKERIYATITLLAVIAAQLHEIESRRALGVAASILGATVALWLATMVAAHMSYRAIQGKTMPLTEYRKRIFDNSGLFAPAAVPVFLMLLSAVGLISLKFAVIGAIVALLVALVVLSLVAGRKIYESKFQLLFVSLVELVIGIGIVLLKLAVE